MNPQFKEKKEYEKKNNNKHREAPAYLAFI